MAKKVDGIAEVRDESDRFGLSVVIELKKDANAEGIQTYLFKNTDLQVTYNFNMVAIADMKPKQLGLKPMLEAISNTVNKSSPVGRNMIWPRLKHANTLSKA